MNPFLSALARKVTPYTPGEQLNTPDLIKINTNENPYPPSPKAIEAMQGVVNSTLRLYPQPDADEFIKAVAIVHDVSDDMVFAGNGSDEVLAFAFMAFFDPGRPIFFPDLTYSFYPVYADLFNLDTQQIPVRQDYSIYPPDYTGDNGGIVIANPNAPTARSLPRFQVEQLIRNAPDSVVILDEAYTIFSGESMVDLTKKYDNLLVVNTLSKSHSLAGLRVGYAVGQPHLIDGLNRIKNSFNSYTMDRVAIAGATAAMLDTQYAADTARKIIATREAFCEKLTGLGFTYPPSSANFVLATHESAHARDIFQRLRERGVLVRYFDLPRLDNSLRISIGTDEAMAKVGRILEDIVDELDIF
ncbi:MAG: histidinol-phosphate transaminase [Christensenellales bacterium]